MPIGSERREVDRATVVIANPLDQSVMQNKEEMFYREDVRLKRPDSNNRVSNEPGAVQEGAWLATLIRCLCTGRS